MRRLAPLLLLTLPLVACSDSSEGAGDDAAADPVGFMRSAIDELMTRDEHDPDQTIDVQHILIAYADAPRVTGVTRSLEEAEAEAARLYARLLQGEDFKTLLEAHTDDKGGPPIYSLEGRGASFVEGFKKVAWRLEVGEIGVAPWDAQESEYGWHIIQRLK